MRYCDTTGVQGCPRRHPQNRRQGREGPRGDRAQNPQVLQAEEAHHEEEEDLLLHRADQAPDQQAVLVWQARGPRVQDAGEEKPGNLRGQEQHQDDTLLGATDKNRSTWLTEHSYT